MYTAPGGTRKDQKLVREYGFKVCMVPPTPGENFSVMTDMYTQFVPENFNHPNFRVLFFEGDVNRDDEYKQYHFLLHELAERVKSGERFTHGQEYFGLFKSNTPVRFITSQLGNDFFLQVLLPDPAGLFPDHPDCNPIFQLQVTSWKDAVRRRMLEEQGFVTN